MKSFLKGFIKGTVYVFIGGIFICAIFGFPVMWLWNWLMPTIFGLTKITFWQAVGLELLCCCLFKSSSNGKEV